MTSTVGIDVQAGLVVCGFETGAVEMTPSQFARVLAERQRTGRCLTEAEVLRLVEPEGGDDCDA